jgi:nitroreductase
MKAYQLILKRRTIRKFKSKRLKKTDLFACVNAARLAPSSANLQPLRYVLVMENLEDIFECTRWAGYFNNGAPEKHERPTAYIVILSDRRISVDSKYDVGLAAGSIIFTAIERGIASCIIGSLERDKMLTRLGVSKDYAVELVIAMGYPKQSSIADKFSGNVKYWLDDNGLLHVPKRDLKDIMHVFRKNDFKLA